MSVHGDPLDRGVAAVRHRTHELVRVVRTHGQRSLGPDVSPHLSLEFPGKDLSNLLGLNHFERVNILRKNKVIFYEKII